MRSRVCVVGSINLDTVCRVDALPRPGETVLASSARVAPGGKGANQAVAAARAGARVQFVGAVGDDAAADRLCAHLVANHVGVAGVIGLPGQSGQALIVVGSDGENTVVVVPGANGRLTLEDRARPLIDDCDVLLLQLEIPVPTAVAAAEHARAAGATVILNASPAGADATALAALAALTDVVVVNESEAAHWGWSVRHRVVTRGAAGARYTSSRGTVDVPAPAVTPVDTTGAGDVFAGVLAAEWSAGPETALRRAAAAGALATLVPGAGDCAPTADAIRAATAHDTMPG